MLLTVNNNFHHTTGNLLRRNKFMSRESGEPDMSHRVSQCDTVLANRNGESVSPVANRNGELVSPVVIRRYCPDTYRIETLTCTLTLVVVDSAAKDPNPSSS